jgi:aminomethyltransferase
MAQRTALYEAHLAAGAKMVDFSGWEMPIHYGSQIDEHHQVRRDAGMFDVSHMTVVDLHGVGARSFLQHLLANDVGKIPEPGRALYSCMLNEEGGVIDDLITYHLDERWYRMVVNAATREKDLAWISQQSIGFSIDVMERPEMAMLAVQGPNARQRVEGLLAPEDAACAEALAPFGAVQCGDLFIARTGYTGEDGFEVVLPSDEIRDAWDMLLAAGVKPCGLGARDTLRLEAGMNLYGQDMDESVSPLESGLGWTVSLEGERDFVGRPALQDQKAAGVTRQLVGLLFEGRGVLRHGQRVVTAAGDGEITSGSYSPTLERSIALARVPVHVAVDGSERVQVEIRGQLHDARVVRPPFVRHGKVRDGIL